MYNLFWGKKRYQCPRAWSLEVSKARISYSAQLHKVVKTLTEKRARHIKKATAIGTSSTDGSG
jgi:hypothetical protein